VASAWTQQRIWELEVYLRQRIWELELYLRQIDLLQMRAALEELR
jgi:hypothetical protein